MRKFSERVLALALMVPKGRVTTYGRIARAALGLARRPMTEGHSPTGEAGSGGFASQSITGILSRAYDEGIKDIPFHRIVYSNGRIWIDDKHRKERMKLYRKEGIKIDKNDKIVNFEEVVVEFR